jgi:cyclase
MLSKRIIAVILLRDGRAVKSKRFEGYRDVGDPVSQARIYYANGIDELVILNTQREKGVQPLLDVLPKISEQCFIPIAAGGGIKSTDDASALVKAGAEKVVLRSNLRIADDICQRLGAQSLVWCIDHMEDGGIKEAIGKAGEVIIQSMDRDGMMQGYDTIPVKCDVPLIRLGGCGNFQHMLDAFRAGADACAAGSLWAFTDSNPMRAKAFLRNHGINVRNK